MKALYRVKYELRSIDDGDEKTAEWQMQDPVTVLADQDARSAVAKLEKKMVPSSFTWTDDDAIRMAKASPDLEWDLDSMKHVTKYVGFRLIGVEHLHDVDYP